MAIDNPFWACQFSETADHYTDGMSPRSGVLHGQSYRKTFAGCYACSHVYIIYTYISMWEKRIYIYKYTHSIYIHIHLQKKN